MSKAFDEGFQCDSIGARGPFVRLDFLPCLEHVAIVDDKFHELNWNWTVGFRCLVLKGRLICAETPKSTGLDGVASRRDGRARFCVFETVCGHDPWYLKLKLFGPSCLDCRVEGQYYDLCCLLLTRFRVTPSRPGFQPIMLTPRYAQQISPNKNVIFPCPGSPSTSVLFSGSTSRSPARSSRTSASYGISVRNLAGLGVKSLGSEFGTNPAFTHIFAGFLPTVGHPSAVAFTSYWCFHGIFIWYTDSW